MVKVDCVFRFYKTADLLKQMSFIVTLHRESCACWIHRTISSCGVASRKGPFRVNPAQKAPSGGGADGRWCFCLQNFKEASFTVIDVKKKNKKTNHDSHITKQMCIHYFMFKASGFRLILPATDKVFVKMLTLLIRH